MRNVVVVISARASYSRIRTVLLALNKNEKTSVAVVLVASAALSAYGDVYAQLEADGIRIEDVLHTLVEGSNESAQVKTSGLCMIELATVFRRVCPDAVVTVADRYETLATAVAAAYMNIPLIHLQGGEVTGNIDEKVRHSVSKLADVHLVCTERAREYLIRMGEEPGNIYVTGCPSCDLAETVYARYAQGGARHFPDSLPDVMKDVVYSDYLVLLLHSVTDAQEDVKQGITQMMDALCRSGLPVLWVGGNVDAGADEVFKRIQVYLDNHPVARFYPISPLDSEDFLELLLYSRGIVGNSSVGIRECSYLGVPAINIGTRQNGRERGDNVIDVGFSEAEISGALAELDSKRGCRSGLYGDGHAGLRIAEYIADCRLNNNKVLTYVREGRV